MQHAAQDVSPFDWTITRRACQQKRTSLVNALVRSSVVVLLDVRRQNSIQVTLVEDHDSIEAFLSDRPDPPLGKRICIWRPHRCPDDRDILRREHRIEGHRELGVTIVDEEADGECSVLNLPTEVTRLHPEGPRSPTHSSALTCSPPDARDGSRVR